jgi:hypothetical protein
MKKVFTYFTFLLIIAFVGQSCQKDEYATNASDRLRFSLDTITFDTIFTEVGSVTKVFKVYNPHDKYIKISEAYLQGGVSSNFRINIDGTIGYSQSRITVPPKDSLFVFVEVTLDPTGNTLPMVIYDAVVFETNGNIQEITLEAFGQDVHLINGEVIESQTWTNDKPYLIYRGVAIDFDHTLTIEEGVKVHFHPNSSMEVRGILMVNGTFQDPVVFEGDRFDRGYGETAGRWGTIFIHSESTGSVVNYAIIKNAQAGFQVGMPREDDFTPSLVLNNTIIGNTTIASVIGYGAEITAYNSVFSDSQYHGLAFFMGGTYNFFHSTISLIGALEVNVVTSRYLRGSNAFGIVLTDFWTPYYTLDENYIVVELTAEKELTEANFYNSIIYGSSELEFFSESIEDKELNYYFDHCILKQHEDSLDINDPTYFNKVLLNEYPRFVNDSATLGPLDYRLDTLSPAKDAGDINIVNNNIQYLEYDYEGNQRTADGMPDLGAFERQE